MADEALRDRANDTMPEASLEINFFIVTHPLTLQMQPTHCTDNSGMLAQPSMVLVNSSGQAAEGCHHDYCHVNPINKLYQISVKLFRGIAINSNFSTAKENGYKQGKFLPGFAGTQLQQAVSPRTWLACC